MTIPRFVVPTLLTVLTAAVPAGAGQLVAASLKNGSYGAGTAVAPTAGVVNTPDGVRFIPTEANGQSSALVNWQIGNNAQFRRTGTITFLFKATRGSLTGGEILGDNYGFNMFNNGQSAFSASAGMNPHGPGTADDRVVISWKSWHAGVWYGHSSVEIEFDKWYSLGFAWGGPFEFEIWVNQERKSAVNIAASFPWGLENPPSGFNMGLGDNHERFISSYSSAAGVMFADIRMWNEYRALGDTVDPTHAPTTVDDGYSIDEDATLVEAAPGVLANDSDQDGDALTATLGSVPLNGTVNLESDGAFSYQPNAGFHGTDSFTYVASDGARTSTGTVTITIASVNDSPSANPDTAATNEDQAVTIDALANDSDPDQDALQITQATASVGSVTFDGASIAFTPPPDYFGAASVSYSISDGQGGVADGLITITIAPVNDPPTTSNVSAITDAGIPLSVTLSGTDIDSAALTFVPGAAEGGSVSGTSPVFTFTPAAGFSGQGGFSFVVNDGDGGTAAGVVTITVNAPPPPPPPPTTVSFDSVANGVRGLAGLNHGQMTSLLARLANAARAYGKGHIDVAVNDLLLLAEAVERFSQTAAALQLASDIRTLAASLQ